MKRIYSREDSILRDKQPPQVARSSHLREDQNLRKIVSVFLLHLPKIMEGEMKDLYARNRKHAHTDSVKVAGRTFMRDLQQQINKFTEEHLIE